MTMVWFFRVLTTTEYSLGRFDDSAEDARTNPYAPGAGTPPPTLVGRDAMLEEAVLRG